MTTDGFGPHVEFEAVRFKNGTRETVRVPVATEVPCTFVINGAEAATLLCSPTHLREFTVGFLFSSGMIHAVDEMQDYGCDPATWRIDVTLKHPVDFELLGKRMYTSGCGKGVLYANVMALSLRHPIESDFSSPAAFVLSCNRWLQTCSELYRVTHGIHTAALSQSRAMPDMFIDDIGRHNAVDKVIGHGLINGAAFDRSVLMSTGRVSSEILQKVKRCGIPIVLSRGVPTHQTVLMARDMGITVVGFARGGSFTVYSHWNRILPD
jgi:FdhD protein